MGVYSNIVQQIQTNKGDTRNMTKQLKINNKVIAESLEYVNAAWPQPVTKVELAHRLSLKPHTSKVRRVIETLEGKGKVRMTKTSGQYLVYAQ